MVNIDCLVFFYKWVVFLFWVDFGLCCCWIKLLDVVVGFGVMFGLMFKKMVIEEYLERFGLVVVCYYGCY